MYCISIKIHTSDERLAETTTDEYQDINEWAFITVFLVFRFLLLKLIKALKPQKNNNQKIILFDVNRYLTTASFNCYLSELL